MSENTIVYRTYQIRIKKGHRLYPYLDESCRNAKNLYNTTNFYIRQLFTALKQHEPLQPLQQQVLDTIDTHLDAMNACLRKENRKHPFAIPTTEKPYVSYSFLDALFKVMKQADYRALPAQSSQAVMKKVFQNWSSFFASIRDYRKHPQKYTGRPRMPGYAKRHVKEVVFSNQDCIIKAGKYLKLPKTKLQLNIGKLGCTNGKLKQVRVVPSYGHYVVELVFSYPQRVQETAHPHLMAIDLGVNNLATIVTTTGAMPMIVKGGIVKAINQYYNKSIHRGLYQSMKGFIHSDVNGAANIMRKVFPTVRAIGAEGIAGLDDHRIINVSTPLAVSILK